MKIKKSVSLPFSIAAVSIALVASCAKKSKTKTEDPEEAATTVSAGGGGGGSTTSNKAIVVSESTTVTTESAKLKVAGSLNLLNAKGSTNLKFQLLGTERTVDLRVNNEAFSSIDKAASILCFISQTKFWEQANLGVYQAQVDESQCENNSNSGGGGSGGGSGGNSQGAKSYQSVYIKTTREEGKPLIANLRVGGFDGREYHVKMIVVAPPSTENPAGLFKLTFQGRNADGTAYQDYGSIGVEKSSEGKFLLKVTSVDLSDPTQRTSNMQGIAELEQIAGTDNFKGTINSDSSDKSPEGSSSEVFKVRFDADYVNIKGNVSRAYGSQSENSDVEGCYSRNTYKTAMWRYDVVGADGNVVPLNSGFPGEVEKDGKVLHAHASYWGLWVAGDTSVASGDTFNKVDWGQDGNKSKTAYTIFKAEGKLTKLTKATTTLGALKGVDFNVFDSGKSYTAKWDGTSLKKVAEISYGKNGMEEKAITGDAAVTIPDWGLFLWVSSLNAGINIPPKSSLTDSFKIVYHATSTVSGTASVPTGNLVCFQNCPVALPTKEAFTASSNNQSGPMSSDLYSKISVDWGGGQVYTSNQSKDIVTPLQTYSFDGSTQNLMVGSTAFALPSGLSASNGNQQQVWSGALIPQDVWNSIADKSIDPYSIEQNIDVYYRWEAGPSSWSQFLSLKDAAGAFVKFDQPIQLSYDHTTANDFDGQTDADIVGKSYRLEYAGPGQLWGIPWKYSKSVGHEMPLFSIKGGTKVGDYTIYPVEGEQRMAKVESSFCTTLPLTGIAELPILEKNEINFAEGDKNSPLRYIGGVKVGS